MKKIIALILCFVIFLTGCSPSANKNDDNNNSSATNESKVEELDIEFTGMNDDALLNYVEDMIYTETVNELNSDEYVVEEVRAVYLSKEYLEEVAYNSQSNLYFGYTIAELNEYFQDSRYVFALSDEGTTTVEELQEIAETDSETILKNVAIGTGVILVCVTVSTVSAGVGAPAAVTAIFAASAKTATTFAVSSSAFGAVSAGIVRGYQTGDINEALDAATLAASEGFKWGAISGAVVGGGEKAFLLKSGTKGGLTMSDVAVIQKESQYPVELIAKFNSMEQYEICKSAGLTAKMIDGKTALVRKIDLDYIDDVTGKTNLQLMQDGYAPLDPTGTKYQLHHIGQNNDSPLAVLTQAEHTGNGNDPIWHTLTEGFENPSSQPGWAKIRENFWKDYAKKVVEGSI
jgi:hypothetical protein|nr:HNH/ENDO VII family nuclease [uncultured Blautia sp.]